LSRYPNAAVVLAALRRAMVVDAERGPFAGQPEVMRPDNGLEFAAGAIRRSRAALGVELLPTSAYKRYRKGKVSGSSAPRGVWSNPQLSWEELEGRFLGLMAYPAPRVVGGPA